MYLLRTVLLAGTGPWQKQLKEGRLYVDSQVDGHTAAGRLGGLWCHSSGSVGLLAYNQVKQEVEEQEAGWSSSNPLPLARPMVGEFPQSPETALAAGDHVSTQIRKPVGNIQKATG